MLVYSNSCSFGAPQEHPVYSDYFSKHHNAKLINNGMSSSGNRRIIRTSLRDLNELSATNSDIVALIGLSLVSRTELWQTDLPANNNDGHFRPLIVDHKTIDWSTKGLIDTIVPDIHLHAKSSVQNYYKEWLLHFHPESAVTELVADLLMFIGWTKSKNIRCLIFSNIDVLSTSDKVDCQSPFLKSLVESFLGEPCVIDPWTFSFGHYARSLGYQPKDAHLYGIHGHPGQEAHKAFANVLIDKFDQVYSPQT